MSEIESKSESTNESTVEDTATNAVATQSKTESQTVFQHKTVNNVGGLSRVNLLDEADVAKAEVFLKRMLRTEKGGIKTIEDGLAIIMRAQDLNLPVSTCLEHIHVVNGKTGVDIHIIKALLLKAGIVWECTKNYIPLYEYTDGNNVYVEDKLPEYCVKCKNSKDAVDAATKNLDKNPDDTETVYVYPVKFFQDYNGNVYREYQWNNTFAIAINKTHAQQLIANKKFPVYRVPAIPVDYITEYRMTRTVKGKEMSATGTFSYSEANAAGMFEKDTYKKYPKVLIGHRAFTYCARDIASDILFGVMETTELRIVSGQELNDTEVINIEDAQIIE